VTAVRALGWAAVAVLIGAAIFELVLALRHARSPHGEGWVLLAAAVAMLVAAALASRRVGPAGLFAPAAAVFVTARFYTGDPYYGGMTYFGPSTTFRRYADGGIVPPAWIFVLLGLALVAGLTTHFRWRTAPVESSVVLVLLFLTAWFMGAGH
jgi:hypothetical protein